MDNGNTIINIINNLLALHSIFYLNVLFEILSVIQ